MIIGTIMLLLILGMNLFGDFIEISQTDLQHRLIEEAFCLFFFLIYSLTPACALLMSHQSN